GLDGDRQGQHVTEKGDEQVAAGRPEPAPLDTWERRHHRGLDRGRIRQNHPNPLTCCSDPLIEGEMWWRPPPREPVRGRTPAVRYRGSRIAGTVVPHSR